jgi:hypothetical protein
LDFLSREGIDVDQKECYKFMLEQTTKWESWWNLTLSLKRTTRN